MALSLGSIVVSLEANVANFLSGMDKATHQGKKATKELHESFRDLGDKISGSLQGALGQFGQFGQVVSEFSRTMSESFEGIGKSSNGIVLAIGALGGLAAAGIAAAGAMFELGKGGAELVEHLQHISEKTGISVHDLQIWEAAGKTVGVSLDDMVPAIKRFDQALLNTGKGTAAQAILKELGVTARDNKEALLQVSDSFAKMEDGPRKASDAVALFGKSGLNMIPILNKGREGILEWEAAVDKFGPKIGKEATEANEKYRASVENLSLQMDKLKVDAETSFLPTFAKITAYFNEHGGFKGVLAGLGGGRGAAAILKNQLEIQNATTDAAKQESDQKDASLRKQEELNNSLQKQFETLKLGGAAAYALSQSRLDLEGAVQNGLWKEASAIQSQLPSLEKAAQLEAQRAAAAERFRKTMESLQQGAAFVKPALPQKGLEHKELDVLFPNLNRTKDPLEGAPDIGQPDILKSLEGMPEFLKKIEVGKDSVDEFYRDWDKNSKGTVKSVNKSYDEQWAHFQGLFNLQEITEEQFKDISLKIETERQEGLKRLRQDNGTSTFRDAWQDMFKEIENSGRDFARSITQDIGSAIESLNAQLARFVTTGKGLSLKQIGQDLSTNLVSSVLKKGESSLFGSLGGLFGLDSSKPDGSANNPLHVVFDTGSLAGAAAGFGNLPLGNLSGLLSSSPLSSTGGLTNLAGKIGGGFGSFFSSIGSFFGGFLAEGGDAQPGKAYIVGEKRPELFMPRSAGTIVPSVPSGDSKHITVQNVLHVHGATDADSFRKSQHQIFRDLGRGQSAALSRA